MRGGDLDREQRKNRKRSPDDSATHRYIKRKARIELRYWQPLIHRRVLWEFQQLRIHLMPRLGTAREEIHARLEDAGIIEARCRNSQQVGYQLRQREQA